MEHDVGICAGVATLSGVLRLARDAKHPGALPALEAKGSGSRRIGDLG